MGIQYNFSISKGDGFTISSANVTHKNEQFTFQISTKPGSEGLINGMTESQFVRKYAHLNAAGLLLEMVRRLYLSDDQITDTAPMPGN